MPYRFAAASRRCNQINQKCDGETSAARGRKKMEALIAVAIYFATWIIVIWGAGRFNQNIN
jgi:hypothetical protein